MLLLILFFLTHPYNQANFSFGISEVKKVAISSKGVSFTPDKMPTGIWKAVIEQVRLIKQENTYP